MYLTMLVFFGIGVNAQNSRGLFVRGKRPLPIDGQWNSWEPWSSCYINSKDVENFYSPLENFFVQSRNRTCDNPKPINGGKDCDPPAHRFRQCACMNPLGMSTKLIKNSQISASSYEKGYPAFEARLGDNYVGWCSKYKVSYLKKSHLEIDFKKFANVGAIEILNNQKGRVVYYKAEYSLNGKDWEKIDPLDGKKGQFKGNLIPGRVARASFSQHKVMKYLRIKPTKTYGLPCLQMEAIGCMFTCGELHTASFGQIAARSKMDIDQNCLWRIEVLNTTALSFDLTVFDILCEHGYLDFHDGSKEFTDSPLIKRLCLNDHDQEISLLKINSNTVWLNFVSNSSDIEDSFTMKYFAECTQKLTLTKGEPIIIKSPNYPNNYFGNLDCTWTILAAEGENQIELTFNDFSVESSTGLCSDDVVTLKWYRNNEENVLGSYCNVKQPKQNYTLKADRIFVHFKTDPIQADRGFNLMVQSGQKVVPTLVDITKEGPTPSVSTEQSVTEPQGNDTYGIHRKKKKNDDDGSDWTVITISAFSALVIVLLIWVIGNNIRRFINNRNEVEAHCAKVKAKNEEKLLKQKKKKLEDTALIYTPETEEIKVMVSPKHTFSPLSKSQSTDRENNLKTKIENENDIEELHDTIDSEYSHLMAPESSIISPDNKTPTNTDALHSPTAATAEIDTPIAYEGSVQVHSPLKVNSQSDLSIKEGNNNSDVESCV